MVTDCLKVKDSLGLCLEVFCKMVHEVHKGDLSPGNSYWSEMMDWPWGTKAVSHESWKLTGERRGGTQDLLRSEGVMVTSLKVTSLEAWLLWYLNSQGHW